tara:strand:- start:1467 stop:1607 length:141 start_codon:yes stop_codon:yes gene_type:complete
MGEYAEMLSLIKDANHFFWAMIFNDSVGKLNNHWYTIRLEEVNVKH